MGIVISAFFVIASAQLKPPLDPTYGMAMPKLSLAMGHASPDAHWIWASTVSDNQTVFLRRSISLAKAPGAAELYITADDFFDAFINGHEVGSTHPDPNDGDVWSKIHKYDVGSLLTSGLDTIAVKALNAGGAAGLLARLEVNGKPVLLSDAGWRVSTGDPGQGWMETSFDDSSWPKATVEEAIDEGPWSGQLTGWPAPLSNAPWYLAHQKLPAKMVSLGIEPADWKDVADNETLLAPKLAAPWKAVFDFGKELTGRVAISSDEPVDVTVGTGESAEEAVNKPWKSIDLKLSPKPQFTPYTALRYAAVSFPAGATSAQVHIWFDHLYYPVAYLGSFDCSDPLLTKIWYTGAYTAHNCMQDDIWDAPKRDRARWMGDLHVSGEVINDAFLDKFLMEQTMDRLRKDAQGGRPATELPAGNVNGIPGYSCAWICGLADFERHVGDFEYLKSQQQALITMVEFMKTEIGDDGVFANKHGQWPFVDWAPEFNGDSPQARAATHLFLVRAARDAAFLFAQFGDSFRAQMATDWAQHLTEAAQAHLVDADGTFGDRRQENAMAIYSGVATQQQVESIYDKVLRPDSPAWGYQATPYYNYYILDAMTQAGHMQDAMNFVRMYWGGMIAQGATSFWEGYDPKWPKEDFHRHLNADNGDGYFVSLCHGWSSGPTSWLTERVLGVRPKTGGFAVCKINPSLGDLKWASGTVPTPHGQIKLKVVAEGSTYHVTVTIPPGVHADLGQKPLKTGTQTVEMPAP